MNKIFLIVLILIGTSAHVNAKENCKLLSGYEKNGKNSADFIKCLKETKIKLNTDSKLTDLITGKEKFKMPNPLSGLKKLGKALKPSILEK